MYKHLFEMYDESVSPSRLIDRNEMTDVSPIPINPGYVVPTKDGMRYRVTRIDRPTSEGYDTHIIAYCVPELPLN